MSLTPEQVSSYLNRGFFVLPAFFAEADLRALRPSVPTGAPPVDVAPADAATVEAVSITLWRVGQVPSVKKLFLLQHAATAATRGGLHRSAVPNTALGTAADAQDGAVDDDDETEGAVPGEPASPPAVRERRDGHSSISGSISVGTPYNVAANDSPVSTAVRESIEAMTAPTTAPSEKSAEISSSSAELSGRSLGGKISSLFGAGRGALGKGVEIAGQLREIAKRTDHPLSPAGWAQVASPRVLPPPNPQPSPLTPRPSPLTPQAKGLRVLFTDAVRLRAAGEWSAVSGAVSGTVSGAAPSADEGAVMGTSLEEVVAAVAAVPTTAPLAVGLPPPPDDDDDDDDVADEMARAAVEGTRAVASAAAGGGSGGSGACMPSAVASAVLSGGSGACMPSAAPSPKPSSMPTDSTAGGAVLSAASPVALIDSLLQAGAIPLMTPDDP